jgi:hypothetical protein
MSNEAAQLIEAFDALPEDEKRRFTAMFLRRAIPEEDEFLTSFGGREHVESRIRQGIAQLDRGEGIPEEELDAYLARLKGKPD